MNSGRACLFIYFCLFLASSNSSQSFRKWIGCDPTSITGDDDDDWMHLSDEDVEKMISQYGTNPEAAAMRRDSRRKKETEAISHTSDFDVSSAQTLVEGTRMFLDRESSYRGAEGPLLTAQDAVFDFNPEDLDFEKMFSSIAEVIGVGE